MNGDLGKMSVSIPLLPRITGTLAFMMVVFSSYAVILLTIKNMGEKYDAAQERALRWLLESELSAEKVYVEQARQYRHDIRHHNQLLLSLAAGGDIEKIRAYLTEYDGSLEKSALKSFCAHGVANALLGNFARRCDSLGVSYEIDCKIPKDLPLSDVEVCSGNGNLLENALEAVQECAEKSFSIHADITDGKLCVQTRNSMRGTARFKDGLPLSTKKNGGHGTKSISDTLALHAGLAEFSQDGAEFVAQVILPM